jgi:hypothetical protein
MRRNWFGDRYDHLKWSILLRLTPDNQRILYVAMLRPAGQETPVDSRIIPEVSKFFRAIHPPILKADLARISELDPRIIYFGDSFPSSERDRILYFDKAVTLLRAGDRGSICVFLDPDTGLSPEASGEHITYREVSRIWTDMRPGDRLAIYQHGWRPKGGDWHSIAQQSLAAALGVDLHRITQEPSKKTNVAILIVER